VRAVSSRDPERAHEFACRHDIPRVFTDHRELLQDPAIDVVCLCVPNVAHAPIGMEVLRAGKDLICEKPLAGAFGDPAGDDPVAQAERAMERALQSTDELLRCAEANDRLLMYAENWVYAPAVTKAKALLAQSGTPILDIRAEESHSGSHAAASKRRALAGGGALLILGAHPIGAALHLKRAEARWSGAEAAEVESVIADASPLWRSDAFRRSDRNWLVSDWVDVDTWSSAILTFTDGSKAVVSASFNMLGGTRNVIEVYTASAALRCNITPNDALLAYAPEASVFGTEYIAEKIETRAGWSPASPDEDWMRGYPQEMQDFMECVADRRQPLSDGRLARDVIEVVYGAYLSVARDARVTLRPK
jgi:predicted dehydrogenase